MPLREGVGGGGGGGGGQYLYAVLKLKTVLGMEEVFEGGGGGEEGVEGLCTSRGKWIRAKLFVFHYTRQSRSLSGV